MCLYRPCLHRQRKRSGRNGDLDDDDDLDLDLVFCSSQSFSVEEKLQSNQFQSWFVQEMLGKGNITLNILDL